MGKKILMLWGGWDGHKPEQITDLFATDLEKASCAIEKTASLEALNDAEALKAYDLIFPCWTMGKLSEEQSKALKDAVHHGVGLGGIHGGMGDAFRGDLDYEWMTGGHFVGHPHVGEYNIRRTGVDHEITRSFPREIRYKSEQYYMLIDPGIEVLVDTDYSYEGRTVRMPVVWTKVWGKGRVFYSALGHDPQEFNAYPSVREMTVKGLLWACR